MPLPAPPELQTLANLGQRYNTFAKHVVDLEKQILFLIDQGQIPSLTIGEGDRRGFRFCFAGQSFILRLNFETTAARPQGIAHLALYALDEMDETKYRLIREFEIDTQGNVMIPGQDEALRLSCSGLLVFRDLLAAPSAVA